LVGEEKGTSAVRKMGLAFKINLGQVDMMFAMLSLNALLDEFHTFLRRIDDEKTEAEHVIISPTSPRTPLLPLQKPCKSRDLPKCR
jgi:hypothetical protein